MNNLSLNLMLNSHFLKEHINNLLEMSRSSWGANLGLCWLDSKALQAQCIFQVHLCSFIFLQICIVSRGQIAQP